MRISDWSSDVCSSDLVDGAVIDDGLRFLPALLFPAERGGEGGNQLRDVGGVDRLQRADALRLRAHAGCPDVAGRRGVVHQVLLGRPFDRTSAVSGKRVPVRVELGGGLSLHTTYPTTS